MMARGTVSSFTALGVALFGVLAGVPGAARATSGPATSPKPWVEAKIREAKKLADRRVEPGTPEAEAWRAEAQALVDGMVDWKGMISRSLGSRWDRLEPKERDRFFDLMKELIEASFQSKLRVALEDKDEGPGRVAIKWLEEEIEDGEAHLVARVTADRRRVDLEVDLSRHEDGWRLYDLTIDGAGTVRMYRSSFRQTIRDEGWDGLIARLEQKLEDIRAGRGDFVPSGSGEAEASEKKPRRKKAG